MKTFKTSAMSQTTQSLSMPLIQGKFSPNEAGEMLLQMLESQITYYKVKFLSNWEKDHKTHSEMHDLKIEELTKRKMRLREMLENARKQGVHLNIEARIELKPETKQMQQN